MKVISFWTFFIEQSMRTSYASQLDFEKENGFYEDSGSFWHSCDFPIWGTSLTYNMVNPDTYISIAWDQWIILKHFSVSLLKGWTELQQIVIKSDKIYPLSLLAQLVTLPTLKASPSIRTDL